MKENMILIKFKILTINSQLSEDLQEEDLEEDRLKKVIIEAVEIIIEVDIIEVEEEGMEIAIIIETKVRNKGIIKNLITRRTRKTMKMMMRKRK